MPFEDLGLLFFTVLMLSLLLIPASILFAHYIGAIDNPVGRSVHVQAMPRLGGLGMALAILAGLLLFASQGSVMQGFLAGLVIIIITGLADDIWDISPKLKFLGQIFASVVFIEISGLMITSIGNILNLGDISFPYPIAYLVTIVCFVGTINAFNLADGLDGLASGIVAIICFFLGFFALIAQVSDGLIISIAVFATVLGFLKFNSHPAKLFMGDTGSLMLGFAVSAVAIIIVTADTAVISKPITIMLVLSMPVVDTLWVMFQRILQGKSPASADKTHLHHRLLALGLPHSVVVSILYVWVALFGALALLVQHIPDYWQLVWGLFLSGGLYALLVMCEKQKFCFSSRDDFSQKDEQGEQLETQKLIKVLGFSMKVFPYVILAGLSIPVLLTDSFSSTVGKFALGLAILVAVAFPWKEHGKRQNIVHGLFYLCGFSILYAWNITPLHTLNLNIYMVLFSLLLLLWSALKIKFKSHREVFLTSSFELLLILISWFVPYIVLPVLDVSVAVMDAAKLSCLGAIPLLIAMKLTIKQQPHRNKKMAIGLIALLGIVAMRGLLQ